MTESRRAERRRSTKETSIEIDLALDGTGTGSAATEWTESEGSCNGDRRLCVTAPCADRRE